MVYLTLPLEGVFWTTHNPYGRTMKTLKKTRRKNNVTDMMLVFMPFWLWFKAINIALKTHPSKFCIIDDDNAKRPTSLFKSCSSERISASTGKQLVQSKATMKNINFSWFFTKGFRKL